MSNGSNWISAPNNNNKLTQGFNSKFIYIYNFLEGVVVPTEERFIYTLQNTQSSRFQQNGKAEFFLPIKLSSVTYKIKLYYDCNSNNQDNSVTFTLKDKFLANIESYSLSDEKGIFVADFILSINWEADTNSYYFNVIGQSIGSSDPLRPPFIRRIAGSDYDIVSPNQVIPMDFNNKTGSNINFYGLTIEEIR